MNIQEHVLLAPLTTFGIGGPARYLIDVATIDEAVEGIRFAKNRHMPLYILGEGSNVIVSDNGFDGLVLRNQIKGIEEKVFNDEAIVTVGAGELWDDFVAYAVKRGLWGIENLSGIPGFVGGAPVQNINAYGQHAADAIQSVECIEIATGMTTVLTHQQCKFGYRESVFNTEKKGHYIISRVTFKLSKIGKPNLSYAYVQKLFAGRTDAPSIEEMRNAIVDWRTKRGTIKGIYLNAGSCFKNPNRITAGQFRDIYITVVEGRDSIPKKCCMDPWYWELPDGSFKIAAGCLVHFCEFIPGTIDNNVGTSPDWTLAIINRGGATANEIMQFAKKIRKKVYDTFGITLDLEPELVGFSEEEIKKYLTLSSL